MREVFAHSLAGRPKGEWHRLEDHLKGTAEKAARFADPWGAADLAYLAGLWHDLGKYAPDWQEFLSEVGADAPTLGEEAGDTGHTKRKRGPDHSTAGAFHAQAAFGQTGPTHFPSLLMQFVIAAHHCGLANRQDHETRLKNPEKKRRHAASVEEATGSILNPGIIPSLPRFLQAPAGTEVEKRRLLRAFETLIRMVFSALVDADFLDTEGFKVKGLLEASPKSRQAWRPLKDYGPILESHLERKTGEARRTRINEARSQILHWCREAAHGPTGAYTLTVPTGGGKTLSALAFALRHAEFRGLERVIVALPFLSILDQTADVYRRVFAGILGEPVLVEHHSNIAPVVDTVANRLASENWDAPLIVTTQVQLFESLFANSTSHCRKLHNIAKAVVVLDEVQTLPAELLAPILDQLQQLSTCFGTTLLLTTATQPSLHSRPLGPRQFDGLNPKPREIVPNDELESLFATFRRVQVERPAEKPVTWHDLAQRIVADDQVLAIVHKRRDAVDLWRECERLAPRATIHLSAAMCPAHRREVLEQIRGLLQDGRRCRVVSTQLVEAGVDVDFPVVYRAMAGLESLAQAAGRCNREGNPTPGRFVIFNPPTEPPGPLKLHRDTARLLLRDPSLDLMAPQTFRTYFDRLYGDKSLDSKGIQPKREALQFAQVAQEFKMIPEATETVFVPFGDAGKAAIKALRYTGPSAKVFRQLQPFGVSLFPFALRTLMKAGAAELLPDSAWILISDAHYHSDLGLITDVEPDGVFA